MIFYTLVHTSSAEYVPQKGQLSVAVGFGLAHHEETASAIGHRKSFVEKCHKYQNPAFFWFSRTKEKAGYHVLRRNPNCSSCWILTFEAQFSHMDSGELWIFTKTRGVCCCKKSWRDGLGISSTVTPLLTPVVQFQWRLVEGGGPCVNHNFQTPLRSA